jgi:hypothetical protein
MTRGERIHYSDEYQKTEGCKWTKGVSAEKCCSTQLSLHVEVDKGLV